MNKEQLIKGNDLVKQIEHKQELISFVNRWTQTAVFEVSGGTVNMFAKAFNSIPKEKRLVVAADIMSEISLRRVELEKELASL